MNIKKTVAVMLCAVFAAAMLSGCVSSTTVKEKDAGEVTIFVDETIKGAITDAAAAYTKPVREFPEREKAIILIVSDSTDDIVSRVENGEYADAVFVLGDEALDYTWTFWGSELGEGFGIVVNRTVHERRCNVLEQQLRIMEYGSDPEDVYVDHTVTVSAEREVDQR